MNIRQITNELSAYGIEVIAAIIILIVGWIVAGWIKSAAAKGLNRIPNFDETVSGLLASMARYLVIALTIVTVLGRFGVETASLVAVLGTIGLAIGLALQGTLSNIAAGVMILLFRPFKIGDFITAAGHSGTVKEVGLFVTELATPDNVQITIPNNGIWGGAVVNFSAHDTRRVDLVLGISYESDIGKAMSGVQAVLGEESRILADPATVVAVSELADSSVNFTIRVWCNAGDYWALKWDLNRALKERMDADDISIPYPQVMVHKGG